LPEGALDVERPRAAPSAAVAEVAAAGAIVSLAAVLRIVGSGSGLPLPLLNPDEANIVPRAWEIVHGGGLDPGWYDYPSLLFLLLSPSQIGLDAPSYGTARVVAIAIGLLGVAAAWWLGRATYGRLAALTGALGVAVATTHVAYSRMAVTDVLLTLGVTVCLALLVTGRLEWAGLALGLAASAKYPGVVLVVPLLVAGYGLWRRTAVALGLAAAAFAVTSPFVLVHAGAAWGDVTRVQRLAHEGWLGFEGDPPTPLAFGARLWDTLGPLVLVALAGAGLALWRRTRGDLVILSFAFAYCVSLLPSEAHFDRYVLPLVPVAAVLAGRSRPLALAAVLASVVPLWWSIADAAALTGRDRRLDAAAWIDRSVPATDTIAADPSTLPLAGRDVVRLELPGPHRPFDPRRSLAALRTAGARWLVVSGSVTDRVLAAPADYPREARFYRSLDTLRPAYAVPASGRARPWLRVYRIYP
jgi:4-amino-4-deoxy-L-arabinose transferase-like glycosyltransferase